MRAPLVDVLNGTTFVVSDTGGDIDAAGPDPVGLFAIDTRFLSRWILSINGERLTALSTDDLGRPVPHCRDGSLPLQLASDGRD
jgi:hypothetical protein